MKTTTTTTVTTTTATMTASAATAALRSWSDAYANAYGPFRPLRHADRVVAERGESAAYAALPEALRVSAAVVWEGEDNVPLEIGRLSERLGAPLVTNVASAAAVCVGLENRQRGLLEMEALDRAHERVGDGAGWEVDYPTFQEGEPCYGSPHVILRVVPDHADGVRFLASADPSALATVAPTVTVEAEYGDACVSGECLTMAHHGPRAGQQCPGTYTAAQVRAALVSHQGGVVVGLSHFDLDTLGGCMAVIDAVHGTDYRHNGDDDAGAFWALAEWVDLRGAHRLEGARALLGDRFDLAARRLRAFWAWSNSNRGPMVRGTDVVDLTDHVCAAKNMVDLLLTDWRREEVNQEAQGYDTTWCRIRLDHQEALLAAGDAANDAQRALSASSLVESAAGGRVVLRVAEQFVNHLYPDVPGAAVVGYNPKLGSVTISFADGAESPYSAVEIVQNLWGPLAGGHRGIAGSPRGEFLSLSAAHAAFHAVKNAMGIAYERHPHACAYHGAYPEAQCADCAGGTN